MADLYLLTPPILPPTDILAAVLDAGNIAALQLRLPGLDADALRHAVDTVRLAVQSRGVALILNGHPALALESGCDGAHVGPHQMSVADARRALGGKLQLGASCGDSRDAALEAGEAGADYVSFGAFFESGTKATSVRADLDLLEWWSEIMELPVVAVGGITAGNCGPMVRAGADFIAVCGAVWGHADGPVAGVRAMLDAITAASRRPALGLDP